VFTTSVDSSNKDNLNSADKSINEMSKKIGLIGANQMAIDYANVLNELKIPFEVIGRGKASANLFKEKTGIDVFIGGVEQYLSQTSEIPSHVIVAVGVEQLCSVANQLIQYNVKNILIEKPGGLTFEEIIATENLAQQKQANLFVAYNRRFYASVIKAQEIIAEDGGVTSFHFEFTEWSHVIENLQKAPGLKPAWFICNSTHVIDTAFYLGGIPEKISCYTSGELSWHKPAVFVGAGRSNKNALFSYCANWQAPGRWSVEIMTNRHRLYLKPMETLQIQNMSSTEVQPVEIDDSLDKKFKPGLYLQTQSFLNNRIDRFCTLKEQIAHFQYYMQFCQSESNQHER
jgi:predicted dehydrogenase